MDDIGRIIYCAMGDTNEIRVVVMEGGCGSGRRGERKECKPGDGG